MSADYRRLPSVDRVLSHDRLQRATSELGPELVADAVRAEIALHREAIRRGEDGDVGFDELVEAAAGRAYAVLRPSLRPVINATGVIIHTNLGRAPLSDEAIEAMATVSRGYSNLEFDLDAGERGSRYEHVEALVCRLTGAEAAIAVNNNASALLLTLSALVQGREAVISRGQLVEIGGGFRIPDVMRQSGGRLVEVGTTNRTYLRDYDEAIGPDTAALMRVHSSNYRIVGFTESAELADIARLAHERGLLAVDDLGSGSLLDTAAYGLAHEPTPQESIAAGADLVLFSGDKLLGAPQAGIIAGKRGLVARLRRHPLARAVRMDKASIAGLNATLLHYVKKEAPAKVPVWRMIATTFDVLDGRAARWARAVQHGAEVIDGRSMVGGGSLPEESLPARLLAIPSRPDLPADVLAKRLRLGDPPIVGRVEHDRLLLDPRTVEPRQDGDVMLAVLTALG